METARFLQDLWNRGAEVYQVGGSVRDHLLGIPLKDRDLLVCKIPMEDLKQALSPFGKVALVGKSFGVIKFSPHQNTEENYDIALPRLEKSTGVGHRDFEVRYDPHLPVEEDLGRRDFTVNAMAIHLKTNELVDPFHGKKDLADQKLRQVFPNAFSEDQLRLIRAIQFAARFQFTIEPMTWEAMKQHARLIQTVSAERIIEELRKLFLASKPSYGFDLMRDCGLLNEIFPEIATLTKVEQDKLPGDKVYQHTMRVLDAAASDSLIQHKGDLELLLAALFHDVGKEKTRQFDPQKNRIVFYAHQMVSTKIVRRWM